MMQRASQWLRYCVALCGHYSGVDLLYRRLSGPGLVILMLHRLRDKHDPHPLSTSSATLRRLVDWLQRDNMLTSLDAGLDRLDDPSAANIEFAVTFDDGYHDNLALIGDALSATPAVVYVVTDHVGGEPIWIYRLSHAIDSCTRPHVDLGYLGLGQFDLSEPLDCERLHALMPPRLKQLTPEELDAAIDDLYAQTLPTPFPHEQREMLDWDDVRRLHANGIQIGAHTCSHVLLSQVDDKTAAHEIDASHAHIQEELGEAPRHFAYPNGNSADFGVRDIRLVKERGFKTAATTIAGINRPGVDPYRLRRYNVHEQRYRAPTGRLSKALFMSETCGLLGWLRLRRKA